MHPGARRVLVQAIVVGIAAAVPVAISPTWGWIATGALALAGAVLMARDLAERYITPVERLASVVRPYVSVPGASTQELAQLVTFEYRDAVARLEDALTAGTRRETALTHASDGVVLIGADGLVDHVNPAARTLLAGRVLQISHRLAEPQLDAVVRRAVELGSPVSEEITLRMPAARHVMSRAVPLADGGAVLVLQDLSEAHRLDRVRRDFVANVSHELKTPVAGMRALAEVAVSALEDHDLETARRFIGRLQTEGERLSGLVADLLDLSRVESREGMQIESVDVRQVLDEAAGFVRATSEAKGLELEMSGSSACVDADRSQIATALQNLLENAVRYSEAGTVRAAVTDTGGWVMVAVTDEGIGIPSEELARIFERFYRVDRARSRMTGGTGLGLSIVRHVAENHGGRIEVRSELGAGSTFTLIVPRPAAEGAA